MRLEYIFTKEPDLSAISTDGVIIKKTFVKNKAYFVTASSDGYSLDAAKKLSNVEKQINAIKPDQCIVDECSEYYNKALYPLTNSFERKLRQYLYIAKYVLDIDKSEKITDLEKLDLGKIYNLILTDEKFMGKIKSRVSNDMGISKGDLLALIDNTPENSIWSQLFPDSAKDVGKHFLEIKDIRNDVMHAHNIDYVRFIHSKNLLTKCNDELDKAIDELLNGKKKENTESVQEALARIVDVFSQQMTALNGLEGATRTLLEMEEKLPKLGLKPEIEEAIETFNRAIVNAYKDQI